jgi:thioredoxin reductase (NADPH)
MKAEEMHTPRRPVLLAVDDDADALAKIEHELCGRYGNGYRVVCEASAEAGMSTLERCKANGEDVALMLADQWMPEMTGAEFLARARQIFPTAKRALLIAWGAWGDKKTAEAVLRSMTFGQIDYYLIKPWWPFPDEMFHRTVTELLYEWAKAHRSDVGEIRVVGDRRSQRSHELRDLLGRNRILNRFYDADSEEGRELLARAGQTSARLPVVMLLDGQVLVDPSYAEIIDAFGVRTRPELRDFDLVVIGAGPAGLAATVYGASEGLSTLMVEREAVGGQAGTSSLIRNYLGFPWGISGSELTAQAYLQAWVFGATSNFTLEATGLRRDGDKLVVTFSDGTEVSGNAVIIATGASYRRLEVPDLEALQGTGVFYGAAISEAQAMEGQDVYVVGGANSAGQAAMHLSEYAAHVTLLVRGGSLAASMSDYLMREIEAAENIEVRFRTRVVGGGGAGRLERLVLEDSVSGLTDTVPASALFVLIGARPHTEWLPEVIQRDKGGYILTGQDLLQNGRSPQGWTLEQPPLLLESSMPGVFAAGDVRHRSVKRVASAVGEGSIAVQMVHDYLTKLKLGIRN